MTYTYDPFVSYYSPFLASTFRDKSRGNYVVRIPVRKRKGESGQAVILVVLAMSIFMLGALGLVIDGSHLYAQRTMAQAAADAAAQAGMMSIFDGTSGAWGSHTAGSSFTCGSSDTAAACKYAQGLNGFNLASDTVTVTPNPAGVTVPNLSTSDTYNILKVTVTRNVNTTLMRFLTASASTPVTAVGVAAIVKVVSPIPIIITHPTMANALDMNGNTGITITGGPNKSIQINSTGTNPSGSAYSGPSSGSVDLSHAGPSGTGADFGTFGGPTSNPGNVSLGSTGHYLDPASPILDPLSTVTAPSPTGLTNRAGSQSCSTLGHCSNCPAPGFSGSAPATCQEYLPGIYSSIDTTGVNSSFFDPGIYYIKGGGFTMKNSTVGMCTSCAADPTTVNGMVIYDTCSGASCSAGSDATGGFTVNTNASAELLGAGVNSSTPTASPVGPYYGILFFEDRNANANPYYWGREWLLLDNWHHLHNQLAQHHAGQCESLSGS